MSALNQPQFRTAANARQYLEATRWPDGPICPHCGVVGGHYALEGKAHRAGLWKCADCREQFTVTVGTVFERSKIALNVWLQAVYLLCCSKKGMSSHQMHRILGVTYKTAWFMTHRIREAMKTNPGGLLGGGGKIVEADETFWGKKENAPKAKGGFVHKNAIFSLVERQGAVRSFHIPRVNSATLKPILAAQVARDTRLMTDDAAYHQKHKWEFLSHQVINHNQGEYARGDVTTNTVEGYFSILKRGLVGTYHHVGEDHLHRYVAEFDFRYNHRTALGVSDNERTAAALKGIAGKRLTYRRLDAAT